MDGGQTTLPPWLRMHFLTCSLKYLWAEEEVTVYVRRQQENIRSIHGSRTFVPSHLSEVFTVVGHLFYHICQKYSQSGKTFAQIKFVRSIHGSRTFVLSHLSEVFTVVGYLSHHICQKYSR